MGNAPSSSSSVTAAATTTARRAALNSTTSFSGHPHSSITTPAGLPLPPTVHAVLPPHLERRRIIVVGDIHGCASELRALLVKCGYDRERDTLVSVGDVVNKGPDSLAAVRALMAAGALAVRGNHDEAALAVAAAARRGEFKAASDPPPPGHAWAADPAAADAVSWLGAAPFSLYLPQRRVLVVHAGLVPGVGLQAQSLDDVVELRHVDRPSPASPYAAVPKKAGQRGVGAPWATVFDGGVPGLGGGVHVVFGHHASRRLQAEAWATGIDTGCVNGGELTALVLPPLEDVRAQKGKKKKKGFESLGGRLVSVPAGSAYEAGEDGL